MSNPHSKTHETSKALCLHLKKGNCIVTSLPLTLITIFATEWRRQTTVSPATTGLTAAPTQTNYTIPWELAGWLSQRMKHASPGGSQPSLGENFGLTPWGRDDRGSSLDWKCSLWSLGSKDSGTQRSLCDHYANTDHYDWCLQWFCNILSVSLHWNLYSTDNPTSMEKSWHRNTGHIVHSALDFLKTHTW